jgi:hypothetical protein
MKITTITFAFAAVLALAQSAQAHVQHHQYSRGATIHAARGGHHYYVAARGYRRGATQSFAYASSGEAQFGAQTYAPARYNRPARAAYEYGASSYATAQTEYRGGYGGRPSAWCGWEMRHLVGSDPGPSYNLARNWAHWGRAGAPGVGAVVVWAHHVGKIVGQQNGQWVVESGNDGHALRTRPRSIAGAIAFRWG